jgi:polar amino acid transport system ATP-binding protein
MTTPVSVDGALRGEGLTRRYGAAVALDGVSTILRPGEIKVVIGPTGSGKSTLLRCLALIDAPDSGTVAVDERVFNFPGVFDSGSGVWPTVNLVFQDLALWPHLSLRENIELPLRLRAKRGQAFPGDHLEELMDYFRMGAFVDRYPDEVSGGQKQLAAVVRGMALKPKYLLLDEVTAAIDVEITADLLRMIRKIRKDGVGVLVVTHLLSFARASADSLLFLDEGRPVEEGPVTRLDDPRSDRLARFLERISLG